MDAEKFLENERKVYYNLNVSSIFMTTTLFNVIFIWVEFPRVFHFLELEKITDYPIEIMGLEVSIFYSYWRTYRACKQVMFGCKNNEFFFINSHIIITYIKKIYHTYSIFKNTCMKAQINSALRMKVRDANSFS